MKNAVALLLQEYARSVAESELSRVEADLLEAIELQDYDELPRLHLVEMAWPGDPRQYVASATDLGMEWGVAG